MRPSLTLNSALKLSSPNFIWIVSNLQFKSKKDKSMLPLRRSKSSESRNWRECNNFPKEWRGYITRREKSESRGWGDGSVSTGWKHEEQMLWQLESRWMPGIANLAKGDTKGILRDLLASRFTYLVNSRLSERTSIQHNGSNWEQNLVCVPVLCSHHKCTHTCRCPHFCTCACITHPSLTYTYTQE